MITPPVFNNQIGNILGRQQASDQKADLGLQDSNSASERLNKSREVQQRVVQNHGAEAKQFVKEALTNNSKIINIPVQRRGSLVDITA